MVWTSGGKLPVWFGEYLLDKRLGLGGMAEVYRGTRQGEPDSPVAVKVLHHHLCENATFVELFLKEARIAALLDHPNIIRFHEVGAIEERYFIAMEYVEGVDLSKVIASAVRRGQALPVPLAVLVASHALAGLSHAHAWTDREGKPYRIVHGDLSPSNILLSRDGLLTLLDFGLAQAASQSLRGGQGLRGKFAYMSPEQVRERPLDERSDIFSMGVVLFEMVTGERLFEAASDLETLEKVERAVVPSASSRSSAVPPILDELIWQAAAREPEDRFATADAMRAALLALRRHGVAVATTADLEELVRAVATEEDVIAAEREERRPKSSQEIIALGPTPLPEDLLVAGDAEAERGADEPPRAAAAAAEDPLATLESLLAGGDEVEALDGEELEEIDEGAPAGLRPRVPIVAPPPVPRQAMTPPPSAHVRTAEATETPPYPQPAAGAGELEQEADLEPDFDGFMEAVESIIEEQRAAEVRRASRPPRSTAPPPVSDESQGSRGRAG